jgi:hypothetical protein
MRAVTFVLAMLLAACATAQTTATNDPIPATSASAATTPAPQGNFDLEHPDSSCKIDADCEVKNVGNCCGVHKECVNKDAPTDPAKVKALCGQEHRMGVCSTRYVAGCSCSQGKCQVSNPAAPKIP